MSIGNAIQKSNDWICSHPKSYMFGSGAIFAVGAVVLVAAVKKQPINWMYHVLMPAMIGIGAAGVGLGLGCTIKPKKLWWMK